MIFEKEDIDLTTVVQTVRDQGLCIIKNWFTENQAKDLKDEQLEFYSDIEDNKRVMFLEQEEFNQGKAMALYPQSYNAFPYLVKNIFYDPFLNSVIDTYYSGRCQKFLQTFCTYENKVVKDKDLGRHSRLHVDPYAALKIAFFPSGASKSNGALRVIPGSRQEGANIRIKFMSKNPAGLNGGVAHTMQEFKKQCAELVTRNENEVVYMECTPRDLCVVDTDMYHGGGLIEEKGKERLAIYIHSRPL